MKTLKVSLTAIVFILATAAAVNADAAGIRNKKSSKENTALVNVKHAGELNSNPVVELNFDNPNDEKVRVTLKDEAGTVVYDEIFTGKIYSKKFLLELDFAAANPIITVKFLSSERTETYQVANTATTTVSGTTIVKL